VEEEKGVEEGLKVHDRWGRPVIEKKEKEKGVATVGLRCGEVGLDRLLGY
jgi:hypothetical protein